MAKECAARRHCRARESLSFTLGESSTQQHHTLGVHRKTEGSLSLYTFRVWAPRADAVHLVGDFVGWEKGRPMTALSRGLWEYHLTTETPLEGYKYKFKVFSRSRAAYHTDPCAKEREPDDGAASVVHTETGFRFQDRVWMRCRAKDALLPLASRRIKLYEVDLASWRTHESRPTAERFAVLGYRELADRLTPHVKSLGFTHIVLTPESISEGGRFCPSPRFGSPEDFGYFVNKLHANGIGILYPFLPIETSSLFFDGVCSYHCEKATDHLLSSLFYFAEEYHIDGFVAEGFEDEDEKAFLAFAAHTLKDAHPDLILVHKGAADSSRFDLMAKDGEEDPLLRYLACDPYFRRHHQSILLQSQKENTLWREPCGSTRSLMAGFFGNYEEKFATMRLYQAFRAFSSAKLSSFMGNELAPFSARDSSRELEWFLLSFPMHESLFCFTRALGEFYLAHPALSAPDCQDAFSIVYESANDNVVVIRRRDSGGKVLFGIFNFSAILLSDYSLPLGNGTYREIFSTDSTAFGGSGHENTREKPATDGSVSFDIPPLCAVIVQPALQADCSHNKVK